MNSNDFLSELYKVSENKATMAHLRRVFSTTSHTKALGILAGMGVPVSDPEASLPYKAVAWAFAQHGTSKTTVNFGRSLSMGLPGGPHERPFDRRFDALVSCRSISVLIRSHLIRAVQQLPEEQGINYTLLLEDLQQWGDHVANRWIEGYYTP